MHLFTYTNDFNEKKKELVSAKFHFGGPYTDRLNTLTDDHSETYDGLDTKRKAIFGGHV